MQPDNNFYNYIAKWEGGKSNNPNDKGGATNKGITYNTFVALAPTVLGIAPTQSNFDKLTESQFKKIVSYFWNNSGATHLNNRETANLLADLYWGSGKYAYMLFVRAVNNTIGTNTYATNGKNTVLTKHIFDTANKLPAKALYNELTKERIKWYKAIVSNDATQSVFLKGWINRANDLYNAAKNSFNQINIIAPLTFIAGASYIYYNKYYKKAA